MKKIGIHAEMPETCCGVQVRQTLQSQSSWGWISEDTLMSGTPNVILNSLLPEPLSVAWIGNGSDMLVLTDTNSRCSALSCRMIRLTMSIPYFQRKFQSPVRSNAWALCNS